MKKIESRQDMSEALLELIEPLKKYYSHTKSWLNLGATSAHYPDTSAWLEGFSRPLWGLGSYFADGSTNEEWENIYVKGIISGTDPKSFEYWEDCVPFDQKLVEMAAIAYTLLWSGNKLLDKMDDSQKNNLFNWLSQMKSDWCHKCNWQFFNVLVKLALKKNNRDYDKEDLEKSLEFIEECYIGNGWYADGTGNAQVDYYVPFAMHFYGLVYAVFMKDEDPARCEKYIDRAMEFGKNFAYWFDENGSAIPYGRSQTYRFAQVSFYSACVMAKIEPLPLGVMKGIIMRHLEYWLSKPIFDHDGILTIGYEYPNLTMSESYNAPGSPYWGLKVFACLTRGEDDEFWKVEALPLPELEDIKSFKEAKMIMQRKDGHGVLFPLGLEVGHVHTHMEEKYSKFAYSSKYGFSVMHSSMNFWEAAPDSVLSFEMDGHIFVRRTITKGVVEDDKLISDWSPFVGIQVHTEIIPTKNGHRRKHIIESGYDCVAYDSGFAMKVGESSCKMKSLFGNGEIMNLRVDPNTNLINSKTDIPTVKYAIEKGRNIIETEICY